jgi:hypothetical protein
VHVGGNPERLNGLEQYRAEYQVLIQVLTNNMESDEGCQLLDEDGVDQLVKKLYSLKHYGESLREIRDVVEVAHAATYREKPYRVRERNQWAMTGLSNRPKKVSNSYGFRSFLEEKYRTHNEPASSLLI